jgi:hypothetical protein
LSRRVSCYFQIRRSSVVKIISVYNGTNSQQIAAYDSSNVDQVSVGTNFISTKLPWLAAVASSTPYYVLLQQGHNRQSVVHKLTTALIFKLVTAQNYLKVQQILGYYRLGYLAIVLLPLYTSLLIPVYVL